jgi:hypothetical protein
MTSTPQPSGPHSHTTPGAVPSDHALTEIEGFKPLALLAAAAFPGLGHFLFQGKLRGLCVCTGVLGLFAGGIFIGGIDVIDREEDTLWFYGQAGVGPLAFAVDYVHQNKFKVYGPTRDSRPTWRSAEPNESRDPISGAAIAPRFDPKDPSKLLGYKDLATGRDLEKQADNRWKNPASGAVFTPGTIPNAKSIGKVNELGTLSATLAGFVNLIVMIDAAFPTRRRKPAAEVTK